MEIVWEEIYCDMPDEYMLSTYRAKVFGGWLVRHQTESMIGKVDGFDDIWQASETMCFVADPSHEWVIE
jgi:hypothetical protein